MAGTGNNESVSAALKRIDAEKERYKCARSRIAQERGWRTANEWVGDVEGALAAAGAVRVRTEARWAEESTKRAALEAAAATKRAATMARNSAGVAAAEEAAQQLERADNQAYETYRVELADLKAKAAWFCPSVAEQNAAPVGWRREKREAYEAATEKREAYEAAVDKAKRKGNPSPAAVPKPGPEPPMERLRASDMDSLASTELAFFLRPMKGSACDHVRRAVDPLRKYAAGGGVVPTAPTKQAACVAIAALSATAEYRDALEQTGAVALLCDTVLSSNTSGDLKAIATLALESLCYDSPRNRTEAARYGLGVGPLDETMPILTWRRREAQVESLAAQDRVGAAADAKRATDNALSAATASLATAKDAMEKAAQTQGRDSKSYQIAKVAADAAGALVAEAKKNSDARRREYEQALEARVAAGKKELAAQAAAQQRLVEPSVDKWVANAKAKDLAAEARAMADKAAIADADAKVAEAVVSAAQVAKNAADAAVASALPSSRVVAEFATKQAAKALEEATVVASAARQRANDMKRVADEAKKKADDQQSATNRMSGAATTTGAAIGEAAVNVSNDPVSPAPTISASA